MLAKNSNRVSNKQWRQWDEPSRQLFNNVYQSILGIGPALFMHPKTVKRKISDDEFTTIAWNAAYEAADQLQHPGIKTEVITLAA